MLTNSLKKKDSVEINDYLVEKHNSVDINNLNKNPFITIRKVMKDVKIRNLNYKLFHNIYPTMHHLFKWKIKESENCNWCHLKETTRHAIFDCVIAVDAIDSLNKLIKSRYCLTDNVVLTYENVLFGLASTTSNIKIKQKQKASIDIVITLVKQKLILQRENKIFISMGEIENIFEERKGLENYISVKNRRNLPMNTWGVKNNAVLN